MENGKKSVTLTIGWIMLLVLGVLMTLGGLTSLGVAYRTGGETSAGVNTQEMSNVSQEPPAAARGRRATAASLAVSCGLLIIWISAAPYRRGEKWAWGALLSSVGLGALLSILRIPILETRAGAAPAAFVLVWLILALAISYRDMK